MRPWPCGVLATLAAAAWPASCASLADLNDSTADAHADVGGRDASSSDAHEPPAFDARRDTTAREDTSDERTTRMDARGDAVRRMDAHADVTGLDAVTSDVSIPDGTKDAPD